MKFGYFPGCSLHSTAVEYDESFRAVAERLGIALEEIKDWICCGSSPAHVASHLLSVALPIHNLTLAESGGYTQVAVPCAACYSRFKKAIHETAENPQLAKDVEDVIDGRFARTARPLHPLEILSASINELSSAKTRTPPTMRVACYYGCLLVRPPDVMDFDECEYPMSMDNVLRAVGYETIDWSAKTDCCGASLTLSETDVVLDLTHEILEEAKALRADAIAVACSICHLNLDSRQSEVEAKFGTQYRMPVFYFTQLVGLALGIEPKKLGIQRHLVDPMPLLSGAPAQKA
jgi:heterodisulfide reductase subunit B